MKSRLWRWLTVADADVKPESKSTRRYVHIDLDKGIMEVNGLSVEDTRKVVDFYLALTRQLP